MILPAELASWLQTAKPKSVPIRETAFALRGLAASWQFNLDNGILQLDNCQNIAKVMRLRSR